MHTLDRILAVAVDYAWGTPLLILLVGGGTALTLLSRFLPFFRARHALDILRGKYDRPDDPGQISHFQALSTALSSTIGMGNIGGVAIAITQGGPGAVFWMWVAALVGMSTKFFTCSLAVKFRGRDSLGQIQGGPMYYMELGLGRSFRFMGVFFSLCGMIGCLSMFQSNQLAEILKEAYNVEPWTSGVAAMVISSVVILGGLKRIARVASGLVPAMCLLYLVGSLYVVLSHAALLHTILLEIFHDAFTGTAAAGGFAGITVGTVIQTGIKRAAFSNEAGIGTAPMAHGAARTAEPVREGLVAMIGPFIDTLVISSLTAFVILTGAPWRGTGIQGVSLTAEAFKASMGSPGQLILVIVVTLFGLSTMFGYSYYGQKCFSYLFGAQYSRLYDLFYLAMLLVGAVWSARMVVNLVDTAFALMALPNMVATLILAPRVMRWTRDYFSRYH